MSVAAPEKGTVMKIAWCRHCGERIESTRISDGWYHPYTGRKECF